MIAVTILNLYLLLLSALVTLSLLVSLLCLAWSRRFRRETSSAGAPSEISTEQYKSPSKELLYYFCWKNHARVEPAGVGAASVSGLPTKTQEAAVDFEKLYSRSRVLYTINEEKETETEVEGEDSVDGENETGIIGYYIENDPQQFYSPLSSPRFYTPYSSPSREGATRSQEHEAANASEVLEVKVKILGGGNREAQSGFAAAEE